MSSPSVPAATESGARPWAVGASTGVGSLPGVDVVEATKFVTGELDAFPHLPELPNAGVGADMIGRGAAHLVDLHVETVASGWRFAAHAGADERRARSTLTRSLDVFEEHSQGFVGPIKIQCAGPWTLAASVELRSGNKALSDLGAVADIAASLAEGVARVAADVRRRVPGGEVVVQLDEPALPAVLLGSVPTASGFGTLRAIDAPDAAERLRGIVARLHAEGFVVVGHSCAANPPITVFTDAAIDALSLDATLLSAADDDALGVALERGVAAFLGVVPSVDVDPMPHHSDLLKPVRALWSRLGFAIERLPADVVITPTCGLAGASPAWPALAYRACRDAAQALHEDAEERR